MPWTAAILAGGQARRLGGIDKSSLVVGTRSILERQLSLLHSLTSHIVIVGGDRPEVQSTGIRIVADRIPGAGSLGGLYTALMEATTEQVLVLACDMPFLTAPFLTFLVERGRSAVAVVPSDTHGLHPLCASYTRQIANHLRARIDAGHLRVGDALQGLPIETIGPAEIAPFDPDGRLLCNINTPDDYDRARA